MRILGAVALLGCGGIVAFCSVIFGALMLTSANGPTRGNWIAHYALVYAVPVAIILICSFLLSRLFR